MYLIRFRRLSRPPIMRDGVTLTYWEIARSEAELFAKLDGEMDEIGYASETLVRAPVALLAPITRN